MIARAALASVAATTIALFAVACGGTTSSSPDGTGNGNGALQAAGDGVGSTLGDCPENEAANGAACSIQGRACHWKRSDGSRATGWCTKDAQWRVVVGPAAPCPETPTVHVGIGAPDSPNGETSSPPAPECNPGLTCVYPSTPFGGGQSCTCGADGFWNSLCSSVDDGWKSAPSGGSSQSSCTELGACGGASGCGTACSGTITPGPNGTSSSPAGQTTKACGCGEDGVMYCAISLCSGG